MAPSKARNRMLKSGFLFCGAKTTPLRNELETLRPRWEFRATLATLVRDRGKVGGTMTYKTRGYR